MFPDAVEAGLLREMSKHVIASLGTMNSIRSQEAAMLATVVPLDGSDEGPRIKTGSAASPADATRSSDSLPPGASESDLVDPRSRPRSQFRDPNRYDILGEHGRGALGRVSRAFDRDLGRDVAIKELISRGTAGEARFLREALITARLEHPGIVP